MSEVCSKKSKTKNCIIFECLSEHASVRAYYQDFTHFLQSDQKSCIKYSRGSKIQIHPDLCIFDLISKYII